MSKNAVAVARANEAKSLFEEKDYRNAIQKYTEAIGADSTDDVTFFSNRSACYGALGMWDEAAEDGGQCVVVNRAFVEGYLRAGLAYQNLGNLDAALDFVKRGLGVEPGNADLEKLSREIEKKMMAMDLNDWTVRRWQLYLEGKTKISLNYKKIGDEGATRLAEALRFNSTLTKIDLGYSGIGDEGATRLAEALRYNSTLTKIELYNNNIGDEGATRLAEALRYNSTLTEIMLDGNNIGDEGATRLAEALRYNSTLTKIELEGNKIGPEGATRLAEALRYNSTLTVIGLHHNNIGPEGATRLAEALRYNSTLTVIGLIGNNIGPEGATRLAEALRYNSTLRKIWGIELNEFLSLLSLPDEFASASNDEILAYLRELKPFTAKEVFRMRLMIVGPGDAGKTTLVHRLLTDEFSPGLFSMTDGVSMKEWNPSPEISLSLWDFGGQQVYLNTHAMLFADKTLYLLVWNPRAGTDVRVLEEYLFNIRSRAKSGSLVMLVTTHGSEVDEKESRRWLGHLSQYNCLSHHNLDSSTGMGIPELRESIKKCVTEECVEYSRVLVPGWYVALECELKRLAESKFSIPRDEFNSVCFASWKSSRGAEKEKGGIISADAMDDSEFIQAAKTVLHLFHHWGVVFALKSSLSGSEGGAMSASGDVVLDPQQLADVFRCVITCHADSTSADGKEDLFQRGILHHNLIESIWSGYHPRLCSQFLTLLHDCELCFELFDSSGASTHCSLVPSLLPVTTKRLDEKTIRDELFGSEPLPATLSAAAPKTNKKQLISQGFVRISFDCLLPNFFPKLIVRLRDLSSSSPSHLSRHHFVVHSFKCDEAEQEARSSFVCVVEEPESKSLFLCPGGDSFDATGICNFVIRELLRESFSGMCVRDVVFSTGGIVFTQDYLRSLFVQLPSHPTLAVPLGAEISLKFLSPWFADLDDANADEAVPAKTRDASILSTLWKYLSLFEASGDALDKFCLNHSVVRSIPFFRNHGLGLHRSPGILWLVGRSSAASSSSCKHYLYAVSPSLSPGLPWEVVPHSEIPLSLSPHHAPSVQERHLRVDHPSERLMGALRHLISSWPSHISEWGISLPDEMAHDKEAIFNQISRKEVDLFAPHRVMFGEEVWYWRALLQSQRGQSSIEEGLAKVMEMMAKNHRELRSNQQTMMSQLDRVEGSLSQLTQQLSGVLVDIREELLLQAKTSCNEESLAELKEMWRTGLDRLEIAIRSSSENVEALIKDEMEDLELKLDAQLTELDSENSARLVAELGKVRDELIGANRGRLGGDQASAQKLDQILSEMRSLQSQLDRVEEKMTQFFGSLAQSLGSVQQELQAKGNSEGLKELRELWLGRMGELENLIGSGSAVVSEAAIEKLVTKIDKRLKERFRHFKIAALSNITPQLAEMKQQLLEVAAAVRKGDKESEQRMESMLVELKGLQTQFVEVIRLQTELSENLDEVCGLLLSSASPLLTHASLPPSSFSQGLLALKNCIVNVNIRSCPTTFVLIPTPPRDTVDDRKGAMGRLRGLCKAIRSPKETIVSLLQDKYHIALLCEACRCPAEDESLWYEVREPREMVGKILPLARAGLQFAAGLNNVSALGRVFGLPTPVLSDSSFAAGQEFLDELKSGGLAEYRELQKLAEERHGSGASSSPGEMGEIGYCIREFSAFLSQVDPQKRWANLSARVNEKGDLCYVCPSCCRSEGSP